MQDHTFHLCFYSLFSLLPGISFPTRTTFYLCINTIHPLSSNSNVIFTRKSPRFPQHLNSHTLSLFLPKALYSLDKGQDKGERNSKVYLESRYLDWHTLSETLRNLGIDLGPSECWSGTKPDNSKSVSCCLYPS